MRSTPDWFNLSWKVGLILPAIAAIFWWTTGWISDTVLSQATPAPTQVEDRTQKPMRLEAEGQYQVQFAANLTIVSIDAEIARSTQVTEGQIRTIGSSLEEMEFKFPVTEFTAIEQAIAAELKLSVEDIRELIRYRINP